MAACTDSSAPCSDLPDAASALALGGGNSSFMALSDGDAVTLVPGNQGGQHVWIQVHSQSLCPTHPRVRVRIVRSSDGVQIGFSQFAGNTWTEVSRLLKRLSLIHI